MLFTAGALCPRSRFLRLRLWILLLTRPWCRKLTTPWLKTTMTSSVRTTDVVVWNETHRNTFELGRPQVLLRHPKTQQSTPPAGPHPLNELKVPWILLWLLKGRPMLLMTRQALRFPFVMSRTLFGRESTIVAWTVLVWLVTCRKCVLGLSFVVTRLRTVLGDLRCGPLDAKMVALVHCMVTRVTLGCPAWLWLLL